LHFVRIALEIYRSRRKKSHAALAPEPAAAAPAPAAPEAQVDAPPAKAALSPAGTAPVPPKAEPPAPEVEMVAAPAAATSKPPVAAPGALTPETPGAPSASAPPVAPPVAKPAAPLAAPAVAKPVAPASPPSPRDATLTPAVTLQSKPKSAKGRDDPAIREPAGARRIQGIRLVGPGGPISLGLGTFKVGRAVDADVRVEDRQVSRAHASLVVDATSATIEDLQTVIGTLVNGREVKGREPITSGDTLRLGDLEFKVELIT
jgi:FHA domain-containing protein